MTTETSGMAASQQKTQADDSKEKLLATLSAAELSSSSCRVSERLGRRFSAGMEHESREVLNAAVDEAEKVFPVAVDAYKPSGRTTVLAVILMVGAAPLLLALMTAICGGLCWGMIILGTKFELTPSIMGKLDIFLDLILVILMTVIPLKCYEVVSKLSKNRNPVIPATLTGVVDFILAVILFVPIWHGETLAPTHVTFLFIPIRWLLILIGGVLAPFIGVLGVHHTVSSQKFCEESGLFLKKLRPAVVSLDYAENALALLNRGEFVRAARLPKASAEQLKAKHFAEISLWRRDQAKTAFLEMEIRFHGRLAASKTSKRNEFKKEKNWRAFSVELSRDQAEILAPEMES
jgi:hypothetical protein